MVIGDNLPILISTHEPFVILSLFQRGPAEEEKDRDALVGTWHPARVNPPHAGSLNGRRRKIKKLKDESKRKLVQDTLLRQVRCSTSSCTVWVQLVFKLPENSFPTALSQMFSSSSTSPSSTLAQNLSWPVLSVTTSASSDSGISWPLSSS